MVDRTAAIARKRYGQIFILPDDTFSFMCDVCAEDFFTIEVFRVHLTDHFRKTATNNTNEGSSSCDSDCEYIAEGTSDDIMDFEAIKEYEAARSQSITEKFGSSRLELDESESEQRKRKRPKHIRVEAQSNNGNENEITEVMHINEVNETDYDERLCSRKLNNLKSCTRRSLKNFKIYDCRFCSKTFTMRLNRNDHENIHTKTRPYLCTICSSTFASNNCLRGHIKTHSDNRRHQCSVCTKRFTRKYYLDNHTRENHLPDTDPRRYFSCQVCDLKFETYEKVKKHRVIHRNNTISSSSVFVL